MLKVAKSKGTEYAFNVIAAAEFNVTNGHESANALYSNTAVYGLPISVNLVSNAVLRALTKDQSSAIELKVQSLPDKFDLVITSPKVQVYVLLKTFIFLFLLSLVSNAFVIQPQKEIDTGIKHLQLMTGLSAFNYWISTFFFDLLGFFVVNVVIVALQVICGSFNSLPQYWMEPGNLFLNFPLQ